ncbi:MAG TPA: hypothetical protein VIG78_00040, partial [Gemmatimonadaceae bacterium]
MKSSVSSVVTLAMVLSGTAVVSADPIIIVTHDFRRTVVLPFLGADQMRVIESVRSNTLMSMVPAPPPADFRGTSTA